MRLTKPLLMSATLLLAASQWGEAIWIFGKAQVAQKLIANAWQTTLHAQKTHHAEQPSSLQDQVKPWSWADIWPVARLQWLPEQPTTSVIKTGEIKEDLYILSGAHGGALAFGPGHLHGTATPGTGLSVIAGHRDTHFDFLEDVNKNDLLRIQTVQGQWQSYRIQNTEVRHIEQDPLFIDENQDGLLLITCYPFNSLSAGGPYRFIVWATKQNVVFEAPNSYRFESDQQLVLEYSTRYKF